MSSQSPFLAHPPSARRLLVSVLVAVVLSSTILVTIVLPAEFAIDPTGIGNGLGLTKMASAQKIELTDTLAGNDKIDASAKMAPKEVKGEVKPLPLPNPAVRQKQAAPAQSETITIKLPPYTQTEIKAVLNTGKMVLYSWKVEGGGKVYVDFHGHSPDWENKQAFVRYEEDKASTGDNGSLVAPFSGEHGWYWINTSSKEPVVITLTVHGYYEKIINYGVTSWF